MFIREKIAQDKGYKSEQLNEFLLGQKLEKIRIATEKKKQWLEEFENTIMQQKFNKILQNEKKQEQLKFHNDFLKKISKEKEYQLFVQTLEKETTVNYIRS